MEPTDLGVLSGTQSIGTAINLSGQVAGISVSGGFYNGFLWTSTGGMTDLPPLNKDVFSYAYALNNASSPQVVGYSTPAEPVFHAVLWQKGKATNLTDQVPKGWTLEYAYGINDNGCIVGEGGTTARHAFLMTPTSSPSPAVEALPSLAILSSSSIAPSSPVAAPAPFLVGATVPNPAPNGRHHRTPPFSVAINDSDRPSMLSTSRAIQLDRSALKVRDRVFGAFADELVSAWF
jgi:uncharacterized membrane protein